MRRLFGFYANENGMTIPELLIAMGIVSLTLAGAFSLMQISEDAWNTATNRMDARGDAARTMSALVKSIQNSEDNNETKGLIADASTSTVTFYINVDTDTIPEMVTYSLSGSNLIRTVYQPTNGTKPYTYSGTGASATIFEDVANNGTQPLFSYFKNDTQYTSYPLSETNRNQTNIIGIDLRTSYENRGRSEIVSLESRIFLRNLR
ncbi:MAG: type II secretion system protein [Rubrobacteridae bacterium]|nr:type II secretion system protein [Rubrobacteridae bacterium]